MSNITVVTAFFDIGRGNLPKEKHGRVIPEYQHRTNDKYFEYFNNLAKINNDMVIYTTKEFRKRVVGSRRFSNKKTTIIVLDSYLIDKHYNPKSRIEQIMDNPEYISKVKNPENIEYWNADYVLVNLFKSFYVLDAIEQDYIDTDLVAWIDFGYCRVGDEIPFENEWSYDFDIDKIHLFNMKDIEFNRPLDTIVYSGDVYIQGCHIVAGKTKWKKLKSLMIESFDELLAMNLSDDDQTILLMSYMKSPEDFMLRYNSMSDWFRIFKDYRKGLEIE